MAVVNNKKSVILNPSWIERSGNKEKWEWISAALVLNQPESFPLFRLKFQLP